MMLFWFILVLVAVKADYYITSPFADTHWRAGKKARVEWKQIYSPSSEKENIKHINVYLMDGEAENANVVAVIAKGLHPSTKSVEWTVPANLAQTEPFVRVEGVFNGGSGKGVIHRYSHRFFISGKQRAGGQRQSNKKSESSEEEEQIAANQFTTATTTTMSSEASISSLSTTTETFTSTHTSTARNGVSVPDNGNAAMTVAVLVGALVLLTL